MKGARRTRRAGRVLGLIALVVFVLGVSVVRLGPGLVERWMNRVHERAAYVPGREARELWKDLFVADLHADPLLWGRDLTQRASYGHVDIPRLIEGGVALQAFTVVTKTPLGLNIERNDAGGMDMVTWMAIGGAWPVSTWGSLLERARMQARMLHEFAERSDGRFTVIRTAADLRRHRRDWQTQRGRTAGFLGIEGAHALEGDADNVDVLFESGFRMIGPTHFFDNRMAGSAHGLEKGGLTEEGREMIRRMEALGITLDLAHSSSKAIDDALAMVTRPVVVSHTGVRGTCDNQRNLSDEQLRRIAAIGGVIGIGFWETAVCGRDAAAIARAIGHAIDVAGVRHVALGSDFDGAVSTPFDTTGVIEVAEELLNMGLSKEDVARVMGENVYRVLLANLPAE